MTTNPLLRAENLTVTYKARVGFFVQRSLHALSQVSFDLAKDETLGIVGESGCGKSTLARAVMFLIRPAGGRVLLDGEDLSILPSRELQKRRRIMQIIFQDPLASLNPRMTACDIVAEPLRVFAPELTVAARRERALELMDKVGLPQSAAARYPHEFSGGQAQRIGIARALILAPRLLVCDEPVSALDVSVQAQILNLLTDIRAQQKLGMLFISHDLSVVRASSGRVMVLYLGRVMETGAADNLFCAPLHPYTRGLLASAPPLDANAARAWKPPTLSGEPPSPLSPPSGCVFRGRCPHAKSQCAEQIPSLEDAGDNRQVACIRWREIS